MVKNNSTGYCSRHESSGPAGLPRNIEEIKEEILCSVYGFVVHEMSHTHVVYLMAALLQLMAALLH